MNLSRFPKLSGSYLVFGANRPVKRCSSCKEDRPFGAFSRCVSKPDGLNHRCKSCDRDRYLVWRAAHQRPHRQIALPYAQHRNSSRAWRIRTCGPKQRFLHEYKTRSGCIICGESDVCCLDFHHIDPDEKSFMVSEYKNYSLRNIKNEVSKCVVLCANCHRVLHGNEHLEQIAAVPVEDFPLFDALKEVV